MRRQINPVLIGLFVLLAILVLVAVILYFGAIRGGGNWERNVSHFLSETKGLDVGAPVVLQGVQVGRVRDIDVGYDQRQEHFYVRVEYETDQNAIQWPESFQKRFSRDTEAGLQNLIKRGLRARLALQSIVTGKLIIELGFFPQSTSYSRGERREIPTIPTTIDKLFEGLNEIDLKKLAQGVERIVEGMDHLVNNPAIAEILGEVRQAAARINGAVAELERQVRPIGDNLNAALQDLARLARRIDARVDGLADSLEGAGDEVRQLARSTREQLPLLVADLRRASRSVDQALAAATRTLSQVDATLATNSPLQVELLSSLRNLSAAARSLKNFADYLERHPEALLKGKR